VHVGTMPLSRCAGHFGTYKKKHYAREHNPDEATLLELLGTAAPVEGAAIVYSEIDDGVPPVLLHYMANIPAIQKVRGASV